MAKTLHKTQAYFIPGTNAPLFRKRQETTDSPERFDDKEEEEIQFCVHGHPIRNPQEFGGRCGVGGELLCKECAQNNVCVRDGQILCRRHAIVVEGNTICRTHNFFVVLEMTFFPPNNNNVK